MQVFYHPDLERVSEEGSQLASLKSAPAATDSTGSESMSSVDCQSTAAEKEELMGSRLVLWGWGFAGFWGGSSSKASSRKAKSVQDVPSTEKEHKTKETRELNHVLGID